MIHSSLVTYVAQVNTDALPKLSVNPNSQDPATDAFSTVMEIVFGVAASVALLIIVISGFRYTIAAGDPAKVSQAKQSLLYAVIGLIVSLAAFSIVAFVIKRAA